MPLFLKNIAPELDIFGNRQLFNFNKDPSSGESDSALTLINWFTPISNVNANSTFEFLTPTMKGFRFNHSLSTTGTFGNFNFEKYDRFGLATPLWGYDEQTDSVSFFKSVSLSGLSITGNLSLNSNKITNLANGTANSDGVNLGQLNSLITALGFSALNTNGFLTRTAANTYASRNIAVGTGLGIVNGDGVAGNPTLSLSTQLQNLHNLNSLGFVSLSSAGTGSSSFVNRSLTAGTGVSISNGSGASGNPTIAVSNIPINTLSGYPSDSSLFLNGLGLWTNLLTTSSSTYGFTLNNTNSASTATSFYIQNNGVGAAEFGFNNSTNEAYVWSSGTATIKFGTNGTTRARILNSGTFDLLTNDLITTGNINAQTGTLKGNNLAVYNSGSMVVLNTLAMNSNYITGLANPLNGQDAATKQYVDNSSGGTAQSILHGYVNTGYTDVVAVGDHFKFNGIAYVRGTNITLDTSSSYNTSTNTSSIGRITLAAGKTYKLTASLNNVVSANYNATRWHNSDNGTALGLTCGAPSPISTTDRVGSAGTVAYITTSVSTRVELRITWNSFTQIKGTEDSIGPAWFTVEEV